MRILQKLGKGFGFVKSFNRLIKRFRVEKDVPDIAEDSDLLFVMLDLVGGLDGFDEIFNAFFGLACINVSRTDLLQSRDAG